MSGSLGDLVIALHADTAKFTADMGRAAHVSEREWGKAASAAEAASKLIAGAALLAGAAAAKMAHDFIEAAANLDDMAEKTGASVEELSKLSQQAHISGTELVTVEMGLVRLSKALHGTDEESKGAGKALAALGLNAEQLRNKDTAEALKIVAGELNNYADGAGKTALALDLFGKSGAQLLPFLKDMATEGELNTRVTAEQAAAAEELGKSWRRLTNDMAAGKQAMMMDLVPAIQRTVTELRESIKVTDSFWKGLGLFLSTGNTADPVGKLNEIEKTLEKLKTRRLELMQPTLGNQINQAIPEWLLIGGDLTTVNRQIALLEKQKQVLTAVAIGQGQVDNFDPSRMGGRQALNYRPAAVAAAAKQAADDSEKLMRDQLALSGRLLRADLAAHQYHAGEIAKIAEEEGKDRQAQIDEQARMLRADIEGMKYLASEVEKLKKQTDETSDSAKHFGQIMSSALEDMIFKSGKAVKAMDLLKAAANDVARAIFREQITNPLAKAGSDLLGRLMKGVFGGVSSGGDGGAAFAGAAADGSIGFFDQGSDYVPRTGLAIVHQGEKIIPAGENGSSGFTMNVSIDARGADAGAVQRIHMGLVQLERRVVPMVRDANRRTR